MKSRLIDLQLQYFYESVELRILAQAHVVVNLSHIWGEFRSVGLRRRDA